MMNNEFCFGLRKDKLPKASIPAPIESKHIMYIKKKRERIKKLLTDLRLPERRIRPTAY